MLLPVFPLAVVDSSVGEVHLPLPLLFKVDEFANVVCTIGPCLLTHPMLCTIFPLSSVHASVFILHDTVAIELTIDEISVILLAEFHPSPLALPIRHPIFHRAYVFTAIRVFVVAFAEALTIYELSGEFCTV